ncbi:tRNA (guanine-N(1)-)-methyltransferase [Cellulomonas flavigena DSM 20109]|uniref:tRNA (Guanine-N(1)-)-methyltransferase n=1 Tax=Cellulomonas flavigena (strain ATCC 482 / DSM 20109 / BCRC 11376 / JCM 18109 / NBRC 3775 / NCIMB 8073 / NRS 134) TaxID=446466 RepID=D5UCM1_CELFN|nr:hypothetical protein [Cellulomonas flavigena]ADG76256.1 tRNA (guanine-N(1)-)-methyltransferase [Cellulomonas flavigena DSM 20109]
MHPEMHLALHHQRERELAREAELRRAARACAGCVVRARRRSAEMAAAFRAWLGVLARPAAPVCCPA